MYILVYILFWWFYTLFIQLSNYRRHPVIPLEVFGWHILGVQSWHLFTFRCFPKPRSLEIRRHLLLFTKLSRVAKTRHQCTQTTGWRTFPQKKLLEEPDTDKRLRWFGGVCPGGICPDELFVRRVQSGIFLEKWGIILLMEEILHHPTCIKPCK